MGASLALAVIDRILTGTAVPLPQDSSQASRAPRLKKESGQIDWIKTPRQIDCHVRAVQPWPLASTTLVAERSDQTADPPARRRMRIIVLEVDPSPAVPELPQAAIDAPPGTVLIADRKHWWFKPAKAALKFFAFNRKASGVWRPPHSCAVTTSNPATASNRRADSGSSRR